MSENVHWIQLNLDRTVGGEGFSPLDYNPDATDISSIWDGNPYINRTQNLDGSWPDYIPEPPTIDELEEDRLLKLDPKNFTKSDEISLRLLELKQRKKRR
jgi:hypothetical protein